MRGRRAGHGVGAGGAGGRACALTSWGFMEGRAGPGGFSKEVALEPALEAGGGSHGGASWKMDGRERGLRAGKGVAEVEQRSQADSCFHNPQRRPLPTTAGWGEGGVRGRGGVCGAGDLTCPKGDVAVCAAASSEPDGGLAELGAKECAPHVPPPPPPPASKMLTLLPGGFCVTSSVLSISLFILITDRVLLDVVPRPAPHLPPHPTLRPGGLVGAGTLSLPGA